VVGVTPTLAFFPATPPPLGDVSRVGGGRGGL